MLRLYTDLSLDARDRCEGRYQQTIEQLRIPLTYDFIMRPSRMGERLSINIGSDPLAEASSGRGLSKLCALDCGDRIEIGAGTSAGRRPFARVLSLSDDPQNCRQTAWCVLNSSAPTVISKLPRRYVGPNLVQPGTESFSVAPPLQIELMFFVTVGTLT
jgi:hypothetical protein